MFSTISTRKTGKSSLKPDILLRGKRREPNKQEYIDLKNSLFKMYVDSKTYLVIGQKKYFDLCVNKKIEFTA